MDDNHEFSQEEMPMAPMSQINLTNRGQARRRHRLVIMRDSSGRVIATTRSRIRATSVLSSRGQVVIPREIREALKADKGDRIVFQTIGGQTMIVRVEKQPTSDSLFGVLQSKVPPEMRNQDWDHIRQMAKQQKTEEFKKRGLE